MDNIFYKLCLQLKVFQPFFVSLTMPYAVTRGELVVLQANVFNYLDRDVRVRGMFIGSRTSSPSNNNELLVHRINTFRNIISI